MPPAIGPSKSHQFPEGFLWGAVTSAQQHEGDNLNSDAWVLERVPSTAFAGPSRAAAEVWLHAHGVWKVNLMVRNSNSAALGFYERLGYGDDEVTILPRRLDDPGAQDRRSN